MLTTKYTYLYRGLGALGCGLVILGIFLPWATVADGKIGPFSKDSTPTGWDLAYKQQMSGPTLNIGGLIFSAVFGMIIFAIIGLVAYGLGRDCTSFCYFLISSSVFFLLFMLAILPMAQQAIPVPDDPLTPQRQAELDALNATDPAEGSRQYTELMKLEEQRRTVLEWKNLELAPHFGFMMTFTCSILAYAGARLVNSDNIRLENWRKYQSILGQVHADGKVTTDEAAILAKERQLLKISREDHESIIRRTVSDPAAQQRLLAMHDAPIDIEQVYRTREFETYKRSLVQAYSDGKLTPDESELLRTQREGLGISDADHEAMQAELIAAGAINVPGPVPSSMPVPGPVGLPSGAMDGTAPPAHSPSRAPGEPLKLVRCTRCGETIPVFSELRPLELECSSCGFKGTLRT